MSGDISSKQAVEEYKDIYMAFRNFSPRTRVEYANDIEDMVKYLDGVGVHSTKDINLSHLMHYLAELEKRGFAGSTRKRKTISIRSFLSFLHMESYILSDIGNRLISPYVETRTPKGLSSEEITRLLSSSKKNKRDYAIIQLLLQTGIKLSELVDVRLHDIITNDQIKTKSLWIRGKHKERGRIIALNKEIDSALSRYLYTRKASATDHLFINKSGLQLGKRGVEKVIDKYMKFAEIKNKSVNSLRHTYGFSLVQNGIDKKTIRQLLGVGDIRTIRGYFTDL
jgi:integrase/recombinase XerD